jgi:diguanylate cyclase (GGDEF)-like protein
MFKNIKNVSKTDLNFFVFKWSVFAVIFLMALAGIINIVLYFYIRKQKAYYKKILDTSSNIVLINDTKEIIDANRTFFKYFHMYTTIEEFRDKHGCICDFFVDEDEYLNRGKNENSWIDYILQNNHKTHKVKMNIEDKTYYFMIYVSLISQEQEHYSVIFADITEQELYKKELESLSLHDPLTHVGNRRKYEKRIADEIARACRYDTTFCVIEFDIDFFKKVNDTYGHQKGDEVLQEYSKLVAKHLRTVDEVFRIGGEEFIIIAPHISKEEAVRLAQKLRESIEQHKKVIEITASFGVAEYQLCENEEELFKRVDSALYEAKDSGRNRVVAK